MPPKENNCGKVISKKHLGLQISVLTRPIHKCPWNTQENHILPRQGANELGIEKLMVESLPLPLDQFVREITKETANRMQRFESPLKAITSIKLLRRGTIPAIRKSR